MTFIDYNWTPILLPFVIGIRNYSRFDKAFKILFFFVVVGVITEISGFWARHFLDSRNTMPQSNFYMVFSFFLLSWYYIVVLKEIIKPKILWFIVFVFEIWAATYLVMIGSLREFLSVPQSVSKILYLLYSLAFFHKIMVEAQVKKLWRDPYFLVNVSVIIYYAGNLFYSVLFNLILTYSREFSKLTVIYFSAQNALFYLIVGWAFIRFRRNQSPN